MNPVTIAKIANRPGHRPSSIPGSPLLLALVLAASSVSGASLSGSGEAATRTGIHKHLEPVLEGGDQVEVADVRADAEAALRAAEQAFADAFARRDSEAFAEFIDVDAVFLGSDVPLYGRQAVIDAWGRLLDAETPPFSWYPERVAVNDAGDMGVTTGPVLDPQGGWAGSFVSTWRREAQGRWRVVFDAAPRCGPAAE